MHALLPGAKNKTELSLITSLLGETDDHTIRIGKKKSKP